jgi:hypothetical protein
MQELNKYFKSETREILRSEITLAEYNPRVITKEARQSLKQGLKKYGVIGGLVWNEYTGNLVSGHQKLSILDELNKYDPRNNDYKVKVEVIQVDEKTEKELNIFFNNPNTQGQWDYEKLADLLPDIDYKNAGLTDEDLQLIGFDVGVKTEDEETLAGEIDSLMDPVRQEKERTKEEKKADIKAKKDKVLQETEDKVADMNSYVVLNFDSYNAKSAFMLRFGFPPLEKFIKGELFQDMIEKVE